MTGTDTIEQDPNPRVSSANPLGASPRVLALADARVVVGPHHQHGVKGGLGVEHLFPVVGDLDVVGVEEAVLVRRLEDLVDGC